MRIRGVLVVIAAVFALGACTTTPTGVKQNVDFIWGCWVSKDSPGGRPTAFLRLLPNVPERTEYAGHLSFVSGTRPTPPIKITIARDGSRASVAGRGLELDLLAPPIAPDAASSGFQRIAFIKAGSTDGIFVSGKQDRLEFAILDGSTTLVFKGERDGCD